MRVGAVQVRRRSMRGPWEVDARMTSMWGMGKGGRGGKVGAPGGRGKDVQGSSYTVHALPRQGTIMNGPAKKKVQPLLAFHRNHAPTIHHPHTHHTHR